MPIGPHGAVSMAAPRPHLLLDAAGATHADGAWRVSAAALATAVAVTPALGERRCMVAHYTADTKRLAVLWASPASQSAWESEDLGVIGDKLSKIARDNVALTSIFSAAGQAGLQLLIRGRTVPNAARQKGTTPDLLTRLLMACCSCGWTRLRDGGAGQRAGKQRPARSRDDKAGQPCSLHSAQQSAAAPPQRCAAHASCRGQQRGSRRAEEQGRSCTSAGTVLHRRHPLASTRTTQTSRPR